MDEEKKATQDVPSVGSSQEDVRPLVVVPPDGGLKAWMQVLGSWFLFFNSWGIINSFGVFQAYYTSDLLRTSSASSISWIGSIQGFLLLFVGSLSGPIYDAGYFRALIITGSFFVVFGMMMTSISTEYYQVLLSQGVVVGVGCGCLFVPSVAIIATYFSTHRSVAVGIASTGSSLAGIIYPVVFSHLQKQIGFPWATRVLGFIAFGTLSISVIVMRALILPASKRALWDKTAIKEKPYVLFAVASFFAFMGLYIPFFYLPNYALHVASDTITPEFAAYLIAILNGASTFGRVIPNYLADRVGPLSVIGPCAFFSAILGLAWIGITNKDGIIALSVAYGFFSGSFVSLPPSSIVSMSPNMNIVGTRLGMVFATAGFGILVGNPVAGAILGPEKTNFLGLQVFCGVSVMVAAILIGVARGIKSEWKLITKA